MKRFNKNVFLVCSMLVVLLVLASCGNGNDDGAATVGGDGYLTIYDPLGFSVSVRPYDLETIVALTPAVTGILIDLGLADYIVATDLHSAFIYEELGDVVAIDMFNFDVESLIVLTPDLIIAHDMIMMGDMANDPLQPLRDLDVAVAYLPASTSFEDISRDINFLGEVTQRLDEATGLDTTFRNELSEIERLVSASDVSSTVYFEISPEPDMFTFGSGTFQQELLDLVGAVNVFADQEGWFPVEVESVVATNPEVIFTNASFMDDPVGEILDRPGWGEMEAISNGRVYYIDNDASSIPNHHVVIALRMMVDYLHGELNDE